MSRKMNERIGETRANSKGELMTIIEYRNSSDIDIQFQNGCVAEHKHYSAFCKGLISNPIDAITRKKDRIGQKKYNHSGQMMTIVQYDDAQHIVVEFENGYRANTSYSNFVKGLISDGSAGFTSQEDELILKFYPNGKDKLQELLSNHSMCSIKSRYYRLHPSVKEVTHYPLLRVGYPELWNEVVDKNTYWNLSAGSKKPILWKSSCGHVWSGKPVQRLHGMTCPYCSGKRVLPGFNDLATVNPELAKEWDLTRNDKKPSEILPSANIKVWWKCSQGHSWKAALNNRFRKGYRCPICAKEDKESQGEKAVSKILDKLNIDYTREKPIKTENTTLFADFYTKYGIIEFDGLQHYKPINYFGGEKAFKETAIRDSKKNQFCWRNSIPILRIKYNQFDNIETLVTNFINLGRKKENMKYSEFRLGDIIPPIKIKKYAKKPVSIGDVPFISCQTTNNGIASYCGEKPEVENCITVSTNGNCFDCFYHDYPIIPSSDVEVLYKKGVTDDREIALYLCGVLAPFTKLYSYSNKPKNGKVFDTVISLPVIPSSDPSHTYTPADIDWQYMRDRITELERDRITELDAYLKATGLDDYELTEEDKKILSLSKKSASDEDRAADGDCGIRKKEFRIEDLFDVLHQTYKASKLEFCPDGDTPAYSSDTRNNGCLGYVKHEPEFIVDKNTPTYVVFGDHTRTRNIVHTSFVGMDNVKILKPKIKLTNNQLLYVLTVWGKAIPSLGYARHWSVAYPAKFSLPVTSSGEPDWDYMEKYIRAMEKVVIADVVKWKNKEIEATKQIVNNAV